MGKKIFKNQHDSLFMIVCRYALLALLLTVIISIFTFSLIHESLNFHYRIYNDYLNPMFYVYILVLFTFVILVLILICKVKKIRKLLSSNIFLYVILILGSLFIAWWELIVLCPVTYVSLFDQDVICQNVVHNIYVNSYQWYLEVNTNLTFMSLYHRLLYLIFKHLGILTCINDLLFSSGQDYTNRIFYIILKDITALMYLTAIILNTFTIKKLCGNIAALFLYIVSVFFIGISIQSIVPYSDAYGFIVCSFILFTFVCIRNKYLKYILISIFSVIGYFIKPTVLAVTVAIIVVKLISFIRCARTNSIKEIFNSKIVQLKTYIKIIILCIVSVLILWMSFQKTVYFYYHFDKDKALPPLSFVMIGLSQNSDGRFDQEIRSSILEHLEQGDINEYAQSSIKEQIKSFTPASFIKFLYKKLLILYCSGNFCLPIPWIYEIDDAPTNNIIEYYYQSDSCNFHEHQDLHLYDALYADSRFSYSTKLLWTLILFFCVIALLSKNKNEVLNVLALSVLICTVFILFTELSERYLFLYVGYFIVIASFGFERCLKFIESKNIRIFKPSKT